MGKKGIISKNLLLLVLLLLSQGAFAADCKCIAMNDSAVIHFAGYLNDNDLKNAQQLCDQLKKDKSTCCKALGYTLEANVYKMKGDYEKLFQSVSKSQSILKNNIEEFASIENCRLLEQYYSLQSKFDSSVIYCLQGIKLAEKYKNNSLLAKLCNDLSVEFNGQRLSSKALHYQKRAVKAASFTDDKALLAFSSINLVACYGMMFEQTQDSNYLDSVITTAKTTLQVSREANHLGFIITSLNQLARIYNEQRNYQKALEYADSALLLGRNYPNIRAKLSSYQIIGHSYFQLGNYKKSIVYSEEASRICKELEIPLVEKEILSDLYKAYELNNELGKAYTVLERYKLINDSLINVENATLITELEQKYKKAENEQKIAALNHQEEVSALNIKLLIVGILTLGLLALAVYVISKQRLLKKERDLLQTEQRLNRARMEPHFFFNALSSIQSMALDPVKRDSVPTYLSKFAKVIRQSLESSYYEMIALEEEVDFITNYIQVQQLRYPSKFDFKITIDTSLDPTEVNIPSMLVQPFIENSIEHGFSKIDYLGMLHIAFKRSSEGLQITISDNGRGATANKEHKTYPSRAMQIVKDRLYLLEKKSGKKSSYNVASSVTFDSGLDIIITLPLITH